MCACTRPYATSKCFLKSAFCGFIRSAFAFGNVHFGTRCLLETQAVETPAASATVLKLMGCRFPDWVIWRSVSSTRCRVVSALVRAAIFRPSILRWCGMFVFLQSSYERFERRNQLSAFYVYKSICCRSNRWPSQKNQEIASVSGIVYCPSPSFPCTMNSSRSS